MASIAALIASIYFLFSMFLPLLAVISCDLQSTIPVKKLKKKFKNTLKSAYFHTPAATF